MSVSYIIGAAAKSTDFLKARKTGHKYLPQNTDSRLYSQLLLYARAVFVVGPARPRTQHGFHDDTKVKPEAATAVIELLMMGGRTPETC
jgi:hypothetical protein